MNLRLEQLKDKLSKEHIIVTSRVTGNKITVDGHGKLRVYKKDIECDLGNSNLERIVCLYNNTKSLYDYSTGDFLVRMKTTMHVYLSDVEKLTEGKRYRICDDTPNELAIRDNLGNKIWVHRDNYYGRWRPRK